jgi:GWxTD domain-containing protein
MAIFLVFLGLIIACSSTSRVSLTNLSYLYQPEEAFTDLPVIVFNTDDSTSMAIVEVHLGDMQYVKIENTDFKSSYYRLKYRVMGSYDSKEVLDSGTVVSGDTLNAGRNISILKSFEMKTKGLSKGVLEVELSDLNRRQSVRRFVTLDRSSRFTRQNYMVVNEDNYPLFRDYVTDDLVRIVSNDPFLEKLHVRCYFRDFPLARPPFIESRQDVFDYKADSVFQVPVVDGRTQAFTLPKEGFYHFQSDTTQRDGFTLFCFYDGFPEIATTAQLVTPLRYITTKSEYEKITEGEDQKEAVDQFWLNTAGNPARAKTLIQKYYSNIEEANQYFTSYHEGWKTDRGIIYIIFDRPDYVYRGESSEEWIYGEPEHRNSLRFDFVKVKNPFTDNDYMLLRNPAMKEPWYITVQSWRR